MNVLVIGANGKIGRLLVEKLAMEKAFSFEQWFEKPNK